VVVVVVDDVIAGSIGRLKGATFVFREYGEEGERIVVVGDEDKDEEDALVGDEVKEDEEAPDNNRDC